MGKFEMQRFLEKLGLVSYILAFSAGLWAWPATFLAAWYIKSTIFRAFLVAYLAYIWIGPGRQQPGRADGPTFLKRLPNWKWLAAYFPVKLHKTVDLPSGSNYLFALHPHGIITISGWTALGTDGCNFSKKFPGIEMHLCTLVPNFYTPFLRDFLLWNGIRDCARSSILRILGTPGHSIALVVGGAKESLLSSPDSYDLVLSNRKGFVAVAIEAQVPLVPVLLFGETNVFDVVPVDPSSSIGKFQQWLMRVWGATLPVVQPSGGVANQRNCPLNVVVGEPLPVPHWAGGNIRSPEGQKLVSDTHEAYVAALRNLWNANKRKFAFERKSTLRFVE